MGYGLPRPLYGNLGRPLRWAKLYDKSLECIEFTVARAVVGVTVDGWTSRYPCLRNNLHTIWNGFGRMTAHI